MNDLTTSEPFKVRINGREQEVPAGLDLVRLIERLGLKGDRIAIEVNREIIKRDRWAAYRVQSGDTIEIVHFVGGGSFQR